MKATVMLVLASVCVVMCSCTSTSTKEEPSKPNTAYEGAHGDAHSISN